MKILYTATVLSHICQFHLPYLQSLQEQGHIVHVAARNNLSEKNGLALKYADRLIEIPFQRSPFKPQNWNAYRILKKLIQKEKYDLIVCNTPVGGILTRLAAKAMRKLGTRVIYIAHGFHFFNGANRKNWLMYYPLEKWMAHFCDVIITVNKEDYELAKAKFHTWIERIHGIGVSAERYHPVSIAEKAALRKTEKLGDADFVILCTGELNKNKDQQTLIKATAQLKGQIPKLKVLLAGNGPLESDLRKLSDSLGLQNIVQFLGYRTDLEKVVPAIDLVVSCSQREGMPLNIIEAMLCEKPVVASNNRGHKELVIPGETGMLFQFGDAEGLQKGIVHFYQNIRCRIKAGKNGAKYAEAYTTKEVKKTLLQILLKEGEESLCNH